MALKHLDVLDRIVIPIIDRYYIWLGRISLFIIYFYFGLIKIVATSPAAPLVYSLQRETLPFIPFQTFYTSFSIFEMFIGILFLIPKLTKLAFILFIIHIITTVMPLVLLPSYAWQSTFVPTLDGQYMIKNLALIALACSILINSRKK